MFELNFAAKTGLPADKIALWALISWPAMMKQISQPIWLVKRFSKSALQLDFAALSPLIKEKDDGREYQT